MAISGDTQLTMKLSTAVAGAAAFGLTIVGGYWAFLQPVFSGYDLRLTDAMAGISAVSGDGADIRRFAEDQNTALRAELAQSRKEMATQLEKLGDRIVTANAEVGNRIDLLRTELVDSMDRRDLLLSGRFDRLEQKMDTMLTRITFQPAIDTPAGTYMIDASGTIRGEQGEVLGTLPAVLKPSPEPTKP